MPHAWPGQPVRVTRGEATEGQTGHGDWAQGGKKRTQQGRGRGRGCRAHWWHACQKGWCPCPEARSATCASPTLATKAGQTQRSRKENPSSFKACFFPEVFPVPICRRQATSARATRCPGTPRWTSPAQPRYFVTPHGQSHHGITPAEHAERRHLLQLPRARQNLYPSLYLFSVAGYPICLIRHRCFLHFSWEHFPFPANSDPFSEAELPCACAGVGEGAGGEGRGKREVAFCCLSKCVLKQFSD